jgi:hypothetical protein
VWGRTGPVLFRVLEGGRTREGGALGSRLLGDFSGGSDFESAVGAAVFQNSKPPKISLVSNSVNFVKFDKI